MKLDFETDSAAISSSYDYDQSEASSSDFVDASQKLSAGIKAAQDGDFNGARVLLLEVSEVEPDNEDAWLWLGSISQYPEELLIFLNNALSVNPHNERALQWLKATKSVLSKSFVERGIEAARENQSNFAKQCFVQAIAHEDDNEAAWLWLASVSAELDEKSACLEKVLTINPQNETASGSLEIVRKQLAEAHLPQTRDNANSRRELANGSVFDFSGIADFEKTPAELPYENDLTPRRRDSANEDENIHGDFQAADDPDEKNFFETNSAPGRVEIFDLSEAETAEEFSAVEANPPSYYENEITPHDTAVATAPSSSLAVDSETETLTEQSVKMAVCPFCTAEIGAQAIICPICGAMNSISDLEMLLAHQNENPEKLCRAVKQMESANVSDDADAAALKLLGVGKINLKRFREGFSYLQAAAQKNPNDVVLSRQTNAFAIRLAEIEQQSAALESAVKNKTILVVDDSQTVRKLIADKLEKCGHTVVCAVDGKDALEKIGEVLPDLVLLDVAMPQMDGYQVCKMIRSGEKTKNIPVVMISGKDGFFDKVRGRLAGTTGYVTKPFGPDALMKTIEDYIIEARESE